MATNIESRIAQVIQQVTTVQIQRAVTAIFMFALAIMLLTGCQCIINHFDGKAQAYKVAKKHWKLHPECEGSMICKRTGAMIPPGPWKTGAVGTNQYHGVITNVPPQTKDWPTNASNVGVYFTTNTLQYETYPPTTERTVEAHWINL